MQDELDPLLEESYGFPPKKTSSKKFADDHVDGDPLLDEDDPLAPVDADLESLDGDDDLFGGGSLGFGREEEL